MLAIILLYILLYISKDRKSIYALYIHARADVHV